jgi:branched-subunit amino acid transport protein
MSVWVVIVTLAAATYTLRVLPLVAFSPVTDGSTMARLLQFASVAALTALVATSLRGESLRYLDVPLAVACAAGLRLSRRGAATMTSLAGGTAAYAAATAMQAVLE